VDASCACGAAIGGGARFRTYRDRREAAWIGTALAEMLTTELAVDGAGAHGFRGTVRGRR